MADQQHLDFFFDFVSPYGYLGSVAVERLAERRGIEIVWHPVLLGISVLKVMGLKALQDTPVKRDYVRHDLERFARFLEIPFRRPEAPIRPLAAARAFTWLNGLDPHGAKRFARAVYQASWAEARDISSVEFVVELGRSLGFDEAGIRAATADEVVKGSLRAKVDAAIARGVFGVPTFMTGGELFWGVDRLPMLEAWLDRGGW